MLRLVIQIYYKSLGLLQKDDKLTNIRKGKVILVKYIVISSFSKFSLKPGAIKITNKGMKISIIKTRNSKPIDNKLKILVAKFSALFFLTANFDE